MRPAVRACLVTLILGIATAAPASEIPPPEAVFGHPVGADRKLVAYPDVLAYLKRVAEASDRVSIESAGRSTLGNEMPIVVLTSPANQADLANLRSIGRKLALPYGLRPEAAEELVREGKAIALVTCTIHSTEVACTQMATELVHEYATTQDPRRLRWMDDAILLLMPSINPDGQILVVDWYREWLGTEYEGGRMPWLYHHYVGHDDNRDFYMLTQKETQVVNDVLYHRWFPQVFLDEHQMGSSGPRMFVPPQTDPLAGEIDSLIFRQADLLGTNMSRRLEEAGKRGVGHNMIFDSYWPGGTRNTAWWKNVTGLLTEVASVRIATPIYIEPGELRGGFKGLPEYTRRANYPSPWEGGWWRLRDIVDYELIATWAFLETVAENREDLLRNMYRMASRSIERGHSEAPYAFVIPPDQHDPAAAGKLVQLLLRHGIQVTRATGPLEVGYATYPANTMVVSAAQPYRPFLLTMLRPQRYPEVRPYAGGPIFPPYDVTSWSLPISMGVDVVEADRPVRGRLTAIEAPVFARGRVDPGAAGHLIPHGADSAFVLMNRLLKDGHRLWWLADAGSAGPARPGDVYVPLAEVDAQTLWEMAGRYRVPVAPVSRRPEGEHWKVSQARVGLYKPWVASMDEGWTRFLLEQYGFAFVNLSNEQIRSGEFTDAIDVLVLPDVNKSILAEGKPGKREDGTRPFWTPLPPRYAGGLDEWPDDDEKGPGKRKTRDAKKEKANRGGQRIKEWVESGGTLVALDSATEYVIELFELPVENVLAGVKRDRFDCPGSMLRMQVDTSHPIAYGMRQQDAAYFARSPAFRTRVPDARYTRRVVARYPDDEKDLLISGYLKGGELLEKRAAVVELGVGQGRVVLIGFRAQHRAQPLRTFKLLFNALYGLERGRIE